MSSYCLKESKSITTLPALWLTPSLTLNAKLHLGILFQLAVTIFDHVIVQSSPTLQGGAAFSLLLCYSQSTDAVCLRTAVHLLKTIPQCHRSKRIRTCLQIHLHHDVQVTLFHFRNQNKERLNDCLKSPNRTSGKFVTESVLLTDNKEKIRGKYTQEQATICFSRASTSLTFLPGIYMKWPQIIRVNGLIIS